MSSSSVYSPLGDVVSGPAAGLRRAPIVAGHPHTGHIAATFHDPGEPSALLWRPPDLLGGRLTVSGCWVACVLPETFDFAGCVRMACPLLCLSSDRRRHGTDRAGTKRTCTRGERYGVERHDPRPHARRRWSRGGHGSERSHGAGEDPGTTLRPHRVGHARAGRPSPLRRPRGAVSG